MPPGTRLSSAAVPRPSLKGSRGGAAGNSVRRRGLLSRTSAATRVDLRCGPRGKCRSGREPLRSHRTPGGERHCPGPIECNRPRRSLAKLAQTIPDPIPDTPGGLWRVALTLMIRVRPRPRPPASPGQDIRPTRAQGVGGRNGGPAREPVHAKRKARDELLFAGTTSGGSTAWRRETTSSSIASPPQKKTKDHTSAVAPSVDNRNPGLPLELGGRCGSRRGR